MRVDRYRLSTEGVTPYQSVVHGGFVAVRLLGQDGANVLFATESAGRGSRMKEVIKMMRLLRVVRGGNSRLLRHFSGASPVKTPFLLIRRGQNDEIPLDLDTITSTSSPHR